MARIAVHPDRLPLRDGGIQSFSDRWTELLTRDGHDVRPVYWRDVDVIAKLRDVDAFLWWFPPLRNPRDYARRLMLALEQALPNLLVFPDWKSAWHFDDKIAQTMLLQAAGLAMPATHVLWRLDDAMEFVATARYPLVTKLASGFRANNVALLRDRAEAERWVRRMFGDGVIDIAASSFHPRVMLQRLRDRMRPTVRHITTSLQKDYVLLQEFVPDNAFDTRVTVIGHRVFAFRRGNRPNDFRASGGGKWQTDPRQIDRDALDLALRASRTLSMPSIAVDVLRRDGEPVLTEVSYYYEGIGILACPGHWHERDGELTWVEGVMRAEDALLEMFLSRLNP